MTADLNRVAFVVIGRNEGDRLEACLRSVLAVSQRIAYADSSSTDGSVERARKLGAEVVEVSTSAPLNAARGRNEGLAAARRQFPDCEFVQFLDGDCILAPEWPRTALEFLEAHPAVAIACGRRFEAHPSASFYNWFADEEWNTPVGRAEACGGDAMVRVAALEQVGGFNPALMASEEPELGARLRARGWEIWRLDALMTEHDAAIYRFGQWWRRTTRTGFGYAQAWRSTRNLPKAVNSDKLRSALIWVMLIPAAIVILAIITRRVEFLLLLPLAWAAQIARITLRRKDRSLRGWRASAMLMIAKVPELIGAVRALLTSQQGQMIEYKMAASQAAPGPSR